MKKFALTLLAMILINAASVFAFQTSTEWLKYDSREGRYSVLVPSQPTLTSQEAAAASGEKFPQYLASSSDQNALYLVAYFDLAPGATFSLDKARDGMLKAVNGTLVSEGSISLGGRPGRELKAAVTGPDGVDYVVYARVYDMEKRVFILQFIIAKSADDSAAAAKSSKYFDSFKVITTP
jgi:hypothetical protein